MNASIHNARLTRALPLILLAASLVVVACQSEEKPLTAEQMLERAAESFRGRTYELTLASGRMALSDWGTVEAGTVTVDSHGNVSATLTRSGDGSYRLYRFGADYSAGETYFARETCREFARVPGGGGEVLAGFILSEEFRAGIDAQLMMYGDASIGGRLSAPATESPPDPPNLHVTLPHLGRVEIVINYGFQISHIKGEGFVIEIRSLFESVPPPAEPIVPTLGDRGPGGVPC